MIQVLLSNLNSIFTFDLVLKTTYFCVIGSYQNLLKPRPSYIKNLNFLFLIDFQIN